MINWYDPQPRRAEFRAEGQQLHFASDGVTVPFIPQPYRVVRPLDHWGSLPRNLRELAEAVGLDSWVIRKLIEGLPEIVQGAVKRIWIENEEIRAEYIRGDSLVTDSGPRRILDNTVTLEVLVAIAETYARTQPTLLLLDALFNGTYDEYSHATDLLSSSVRGFQTVATTTNAAPSPPPEWTVTRFVSLSGSSYKRWARLVQDDME
ncbi:hypothetical protein [Streptomyces sp. enrichment culture]|uniref:hypothetical protein n=1 Tax=Streptomyces sp. enrichment culture TaxID=1795815 RepID=UPI003F5502C8